MILQENRHVSHSLDVQQRKTNIFGHHVGKVRTAPFGGKPELDFQVAVFELKPFDKTKLQNRLIEFRVQHPAKPLPNFCGDGRKTLRFLSDLRHPVPTRLRCVQSFLRTAEDHDHTRIPFPVRIETLIWYSQEIVAVSVEKFSNRNREAGKSLTTGIETCIVCSHVLLVDEIISPIDCKTSARRVENHCWPATILML